MKHIFSIIIALSAIFTFCRCSDSDYTDKYADPSKTSTISCEKLMTGIFYTGVKYASPSYDRYFGWEAQLLGRFSQTFGYANTANRYLGYSSGAIDSRWNCFYRVVEQLRVLEATYGALDETNKKEFEVFVWLSKIFVYEQLLQMVDIWEDVPFSQAGSLAVTGDLKGAYPMLDKAEDLYKMMLDDLKELNRLLSDATLSDLTKALLPAQDFINGGNLMKWRTFANSLRLRIAMRVSSNGALSAEGRAIIKEMLENPDVYPVVENNEDMIKIISRGQDDLNWNGIEGIGDWVLQGRASYAHLSRMIEDDDPRLEITYDKNAFDEYRGLNPVNPYVEATDGSDIHRYYSSVDSSTFRNRNPGYPGMLVTAAEISFIKAEAYQKGYATGDAEAAFKKAVRQSVELYYQLNSTGVFREPVPAPSTDELEGFVDARWNGYGSKEEAIATQKWLHFGFIQTLEGWNELRRTGYPYLYYSKDNSTGSCPDVPDRLRYPTAEKNYNPNYEAVQNDDTYYRALFWAKADWCVRE